ncbi:hypothetical protein EXIGLDRAFT_722268 [Exidia glandulosa HHB12029]|uniref:Uncharacterized protein n=1 Tax=Exidia glandulosa HHB12029 TaxID=1314781 RepID=A0A165N4L8_EXIGL|nr:hypothetical protein EXIGLDRAFT_722268 [Exidia glandulosa HHB12029]
MEYPLGRVRVRPLRQSNGPRAGPAPQRTSQRRAYMTPRRPGLWLARSRTKLDWTQAR